MRVTKMNKLLIAALLVALSSTTFAADFNKGSGKKDPKNGGDTSANSQNYTGKQDQSWNKPDPKPAVINNERTKLRKFKYTYTNQGFTCVYGCEGNHPGPDPDPTAQQNGN